MKRALWFLIPVLMQAGTVIPQFRVTDDGKAYAAKSHVTGALNEHGNAVLSWIDSRDGIDGVPFYTLNVWPQAYLQRIDASGAPVGANVHLDTGSEWEYPCVSSAVVLYWDGLILTATTNDFRHTQLVDENAHVRLWDAEFNEVLGEFELEVSMPVLVPYGVDRCLAVQNMPHTFIDTNCIEFQRFERSGGSIGGKVFVDTGCVQDVVVDAKGNFAVAYYDGSPRSCFYRRYNANDELTGEMEVGSDAVYISLAGDAGGMLLCCWMEYDDDWNACIYTQRFTANDIPLGSPNLLYSRSYREEQPFDIALSRDGRLLVYVVSPGGTIYGQLLDKEGAAEGDAFVINPDVGNGEGMSIWLGSNGIQYRVAWTEDNFVYSRTVTSGGALGEIQRVCDDEPAPHATWNESVLTPAGDFFIHWLIPFGGAYLQHFDVDGEPTQPIWSGGTLEAERLALGLDGRLYLSYITIIDDTVVWVQRFDAEGSPDGAPIQIVQGSVSPGGGTAVAVDDDSRGLVVWVESSQIYGRLFDAETGVLVSEPIFIDTLDWGGLCAFAFEDGGFVVGCIRETNAILRSYHYVYTLLDAEGQVVKGPVWLFDWETEAYSSSMVCNGKDRFVVAGVLWPTDERIFCYSVYNREGEELLKVQYCKPLNFYTPVHLYSIAPAMAPDGRFVIMWHEMNAAGNLDLFAQAFSADGEAISAPFQVNDADQWAYSHQLTGWRGVSCSDDRILFTWLENRRHRGLDVMAKVIDWEDLPGVAEQPALKQSSDWEVLNPVGSRIVLRYGERPEGFCAHVFDATGRKVDELESAAPSGTIMWGDGQSPGVYFIRVSGTSSSLTRKVALVR